MDRNLEKNLRKVQGLKSKGQLEKALKQLQDWARKNPDTPHYQYEAAMVAFDMEDYAVGLNFLKGLMRAAPDTREKVLAACAERFEASPTLPLAEFLVERHLAEKRVAEALDVVTLLTEEQLEVYAKKTEVKHRSIAASPSTPIELARKSFYVQLGIARAQGNPEDIAARADEMLEAVIEEAASLAEICLAELEKYPRNPGLHVVAAKGQLTAGTILKACQLLLKAAHLEPARAKECLALIETLEPGDDEKAGWLRSVAELALAAGKGEQSAQFFRDAADADPKSRQDILERLAHVPEDLDNEQKAPLLKLRLRLLVVLRQYKQVPALTERLRKDGMVDADELRMLMGEGKGAKESKPVELLVLLAETALRAGDLRAAAVHANEIPDTDDHSIHKIIRAIDGLLGDWEPSERLELGALQAVLYSRVGEQNGANTTLVELWSEEEHDDLDTLFAVTETCLAKIHPTPLLLKTILPTCLENDRRELADTALDGVLRHSPDDVKWLVDDLIEYLDEHHEHGNEVLALLDSCDKELGAAQQLRYPVACAALVCGQVERAVPEFQVLLMARPMLAEDVLDRLREALKRSDTDLQLNLAAYDLLVDAGDLDEAGRCLARALEADPTRIEELSERFDDLLSRAPDSVDLWMAYATSLFKVGRFAQLDRLCDQASEKLPPAAVADFRLLQARILVEDGRVKEAVESLDQLMTEGSVSLDRAIVVLREMVAADPTNARAQYLLGTACGQKGEIDESVAALCGAAKSDRTLVADVAGQLSELGAKPAIQASHLVQIASFHRRRGDEDEASRSYERSLRLDESLADKILGDLTDELEDPHGHLGILFIGSRAARLSGRLELCCELLTRIYSSDIEQFTMVLAELRKCSESYPTELLPPRTMARILLAHKSPGAAAEVIAALGQNEDYSESDRIETLREFHQRIPELSGLAMTLAQLLGRQGELEEASDLLWQSLAGEELDAVACLRVCRELLERSAEHGDLRLVQHDLLHRLGQMEDALAALPEPHALPDDRQEELSRRLAADPRRSMADPRLALNHAESLRRQDRIEESLEVMRQASKSLEGQESIVVRCELARALERAGQAEESRRVLQELGQDRLEWSELFSMVEGWEEERYGKEVEALRGRLAQDGTDLEARLSLAERLLEREEADEALELLDGVRGEGGLAARRACLLADAYLAQNQATRAEAILRAAEAAANSTPLWFEELRFRLAVCAEKLGRHADAYARFQDLIESPLFGAQAKLRAREAYGRHLSDAAGEYRAVILATTSL